jgi:hypothetical protein
MKLTDLDPQWILRGDRRIGFTFRSPTKQAWRQSCFIEGVSHGEQRRIFESMFAAPHAVQGCNPDCAWTVAGGIDAASFETMTVTPSLDGSAGGLWHGFITNGAINGGI